MKTTNKIKSGQFVKFADAMYLFLGYSDYKKSQCVLADQWGNKVHTFSNLVSVL